MTKVVQDVARPGPDPGLALLPLRLFLGGTFVYGGIQKLSDPGFLHKGAPTYIGAQLHAFASGTPGGFILRALALPHPRLAGVGVALLEIVIGLLALSGLLTRLAAAGGLALSLLLFVTASWKTSPYFLGSDIVFVFAWLPFALAGARGQPALDNALAHLPRRSEALPAGGGAIGPPGAGAIGPPGGGAIGPAGPEQAITRRGLILGGLGAAAAGTLGIAGLSAFFKGPYRVPPRSLAKGPAPAARPPTPEAAPPQNAVRLGPARQLPRGQAATYDNPSDGSPDLLIRQSDGQLTALSAVCTHAGCTVGYQDGEIVCPCHGATFDARTGAVKSGPANAPLATRQIVERGGQIYALRA